MKNLYIIILLLFVIVRINASPLHTNRKHNIIIDTDCAIDDLRAISIILSQPNIKVKAIIASEGTLSTREGVLKIKNLLHEFQLDTIPVVQGKEVRNINPEWRIFNQQVNWGTEITKHSGTSATLNDIALMVSGSDDHTSFVCLGALTNVSELIKEHPEIKNKIEDIIWYNESVNPLKGFNFECDKEAARLVFETEIKISVISCMGYPKSVFDTSLFNSCKQSETILSKILYNSHSQKEVQERLIQNHFRLWDDLTAVFLTNPELYTMERLKDYSNICFTSGYNCNAIREVLSDIISGNYKPGEHIAFNTFPSGYDLYTYDVRSIMDTSLWLYGMDEWKACVMTDEFHGHLGVFSIVGAKMGIRARNYFGVGPDVMEVLSFAGTKPPFSCMNDGIQVSTGATLGQGTIHVEVDTVTSPEAIFTYKGKSLKIKLKEEYLVRLKSDINKGVTQFGLADENYWSFIRQNAIKYWLEWDRNKIFDLEVIISEK